ncbi:hypothetical protein HK102_008372 [Quaeritorhiza haematococci]|nr:hypothetical protein HK102_008372 [Quaeritorhiza haematococci]
MTVIKLNAQAHFESDFEGWGMSLCWNAKQVVTTCSPEIRTRFMDLTYGSEGLALNVLRYNIGGGDDPSHTHLPPTRAMEGFLNEKGEWNWNADKEQKWMMFEAIKRGATVLRAFSNSPPYWMTKSRSRCAAGNTDGSDNLRDDMYDRFGRYLAAVLFHFKTTHNLEFESISPLNEPVSDWWKANGGQEGCAFNQKNQEKLYRSVHKALQDRKLNVLIDGPENASVKLTHTNVSKYPNDVMQILHGVHTHTYWGSRDEKVALRDLCKQHKKKLHVSEYGFALDVNEKTAINKELKGGIGLAKHICSDINLLRPASWTIWQMDWGLISVQPNYETCFRLHLLPSYFV